MYDATETPVPERTSALAWVILMMLMGGSGGSGSGVVLLWCAQFTLAQAQ